MTDRQHGSGWPLRISVVDAVLATASAAASGYLGYLGMPFAGTPVFAIGHVAVIATAVAGLLVIGALVAAGSSTRARAAARIAGVFIVALAVHRWNGWQHADQDWPPRGASSMASALASLDADQRVRWGSHLAGVAASSSDSLGDVVGIPAGWPIPQGVTYALERRGAATILWARDSTGRVGCVTVASRTGVDSVSPCAKAPAEAPALRFADPVRTAPLLTGSAIPHGAATWFQYRRDAVRSAQATAGSAPSAGWRTRTAGPVRASASVAAGIVLVGGHDVSMLTALDAATGALRWQVNLPNWIHQDPVSDGTYVVVGFGDNDDSFQGLAPSGVAAYELASGRLIWMEFEQSSIMASAVISDSATVYVSATGLVRKRRLNDGALLGTLQLPGGAIMAPMAMMGDTLVATLDRSHVCAMIVSSFTTSWCRRLAHVRKLGHAAPTVADGQVILSGLTTMFALPVSAVFRGHGAAARHYLHRILQSAGGDESIAGQFFVSLDLGTGATRWVSQPFAARAEVTGHNSGTAAVESGVGVIVLPNADTVVAFTPRTGAVLWTAGAHGGRGPPLIVGGRVVIGGRDGVIETRDATTGAVLCTMTRSVGFDRAGPVDAGGLLVFADLAGGVEAIPQAVVLDCTASASP